MDKQVIEDVVFTWAIYAGLWQKEVDVETLEVLVEALHIGQVVL